MSLQGRVALVTGGGRGIGKAVCMRLAAMGAHVIINYVSRPEAADETLAAIKAAGGSAQTVGFDVSSFDLVQVRCKEFVKECGSIDILVSNAGITKDGLLATMKESDWDAVLTTNLKGGFNCIRAVSRQMMKKRWGRIVAISSVVGTAGNAGQGNYAAAKAGLVGLVRSVAKELASRGVTANAVAPGYIHTEMTMNLPEAAKEKVVAEVPMGVMGEPEDVAGAVAYLVSDEARYVTGQVIHVNGGMFMG